MTTHTGIECLDLHQGSLPALAKGHVSVARKCVLVAHVETAHTVVLGDRPGSPAGYSGRKPESTMRTVAVLAAVTFTLAACGGGGGSGKPASMTQDPPTDPPQPELPAAKIAFALPASGHYSNTGLPVPAASDAKHMPIYQDSDRILVGVDQNASALRNLPMVGKRSDTDIRYGTLDDGASGATVRKYLNQVSDVLHEGIIGFVWQRNPQVTYGGHPDSDDATRLRRAVQLANTALPDEFKMEFVSANPSPEQNTGIHVNFAGPEFNPGYWGITHNSRGGALGSEKSAITISSHYTDGGERRAVILLVHELLHAMGLGDHVEESHDSILEAGQGVYATRQGKQQPLSLLYDEDREALRGLYDPDRLVAWSDTSLHIAGHSQHTAFGVALRNSYAEPWAYGYIPDTDPADNPALSGSATWSGELLGLTPDAAAVAGDARIDINLTSMTGRTDFTALETWGANTPLGEKGTGTTWLDGDLGYSIAVRGNTFRETGGDDGRLTGIFAGRSHEAVGGTLERSDLTAAFGASR